MVLAVMSQKCNGLFECSVQEGAALVGGVTQTASTFGLAKATMWSHSSGDRKLWYI